MRVTKCEWQPENFTHWKPHSAKSGEDKSKAAMVCKEPGQWWKTTSQLTEDTWGERSADKGKAVMVSDAPAKRMVTSAEVLEAQYKSAFGTDRARRSVRDKGNVPMDPQD